jgi:nucleotide-binding universal stress UspA family protein
MYKNILIATDGSELSGKGLEAGIALARTFAAKVTVVIVSEPFPAYDLGTQFGLFGDPAAIAAYDDRCRDLAQSVLSKAQADAEAAGVTCETIHVQNRGPAAGILDTAKDRGCDLIVVTSHGRHGLERFLLGSQAARVVQNAGTSVLVIR